MQTSDSNRSLLDVSHLTKVFPGSDTPAVANISFGIASHEILGLVGLNGAGKTTAIRVAAGLILPTGGKVSVAGFDIAREKVRASRHLGLVPEFPNFDPNGRGLALLRYFAGFRGLSGPTAARRCSDLMETVGLGKARTIRFRAYSQGMKKRLAVAAALVGDPEVILLDEVLNGLDPQGIVLVRELMMDWREEGKAILLSSHLLNETQHVADRVAIVHRGRLVKVLSRSELANVRSGFLRVTLVDMDSKAVEYLATKGRVRREGDTVWISDPSDEPEMINADLTNRGYHVKGLSFESTSLESLFLSLIEEPATEPSNAGSSP